MHVSMYRVGQSRFTVVHMEKYRQYDYFTITKALITVSHTHDCKPTLPHSEQREKERQTETMMK